MKKHRFPKSIHSQIEAVFHSIRMIHLSKVQSPVGIRSFGTWNSYRKKAHTFANRLLEKSVTSLCDTEKVAEEMESYLSDILAEYIARKRSRQSFETILSAFGKLEYAFNVYHDLYLSDIARLDIYALRMYFYDKARKHLPTTNAVYAYRAFPDPVSLITAIKDGTYQLQAALQYEGGVRAEGTGAPSNNLRNPLTRESLIGVGPDPVTGQSAGIIETREKGGKRTRHYISLITYQHLESYLEKYGKLESNYTTYLASINHAARKTGQYARGRGSHGLKHNFAEERYHECILHGFRHEQALQQVSLELSHFRLRETTTYTRGK